MPVTAKQRRIFEFIRRYIDSNQEPPTIAEIGRQFEMRSSASVHAVLVALAGSLGFILTRGPGGR